MAKQPPKTRKSSARKTRSSSKKHIPPGRVVEANATLMSVGGINANAALSHTLEAAMVKASEDAMAAGITDPVQIRKRKLKARDEALATFERGGR
jgi:hypothetical protein